MITKCIVFSLFSGSSDYVEITSSNSPLVAFTSDPSTHRQCFIVNITDDKVLEDTERLNLSLSLADGSTVPVLVIPDLSEVEIQDEDCKYSIICLMLIIVMIYLCTLLVIVVGFERTFTSIVESNDSLELCVIILTDSNLLPTHTVISFSLSLLSVPGTAGIYTYDDNYSLFTSLLQIPVTMVNSPLPTIPLWPSPLTPLLTDNVSMSISPMMKLLRTQRDLV